MNKIETKGALFFAFYRALLSLTRRIVRPLERRLLVAGVFLGESIVTVLCSTTFGLAVRLWQRVASGGPMIPPRSRRGWRMFGVLFVVMLLLPFPGRADSAMGAKSLSPGECRGWSNAAKARKIDLVQSAPLGSFNDKNASIYGSGTATAGVFAEDPANPVLLCNGFATRQISKKKELEKAEVIVSAAAVASPENADVLVFETSYDNGSSWGALGTILLQGGISNEQNDGYWRFPLPSGFLKADLPSLQIRARYADAGDFLATTVFVDGIALEVTLKDVPRAGFLKGFFSFIEEPVIVIDETSLSEVEFLDADGVPVDVPYVTEVVDGKTRIQLKRGSLIRPGTYVVRTKHKGFLRTVTEEQAFQFGVANQNTAKAVYEPGDLVQIAIGVLDDLGSTVCDAKLSLRVTKPDGGQTLLATSDGSIIGSATCGSDSITNLPDYSANLIAEQQGEYHTALTIDTGSGTRVVAGSFDVQPAAQYRIERLAPTRINPKASYFTRLRITTSEDFAGRIEERVPLGFTLDKLNPQATVSEGEENITIGWEVTWEKGKTYELSYAFNAPDISPALFSMGPLALGKYTEPRPWSLSSDEVVRKEKADVAFAALPVEDADFSSQKPDFIEPTEAMVAADENAHIKVYKEGYEIPDAAVPEGLDPSKPITVEKVEVAGPSGTTNLAHVSEEFSKEGKDLEILHLVPEQGFSPGVYTVVSTLTDGEETVTETKTFAWGVLAINMPKSVYAPNEPVEFWMGAVDSGGHTVCDAPMTLVVTAPDGSTKTFTTTDQSITFSKECGPITVTNIPDYKAVTEAGGVGEYQLSLSATIGDKPYTVDDILRVQDDIPFTIIRNAPTRLYPLAEYDLSFRVTPAEDVTGDFIEFVPATYGVVEVGQDGTVETGDDQTQRIRWTVDWKTGETYELTYTIDPEDISPALFRLGPAGIADFVEYRQWLIASDAVCTAFATGNWSAAGTWTGGGCSGVGGIPGTADTVIIPTGVIVTVDTGNPSVVSLTLNSPTGGANGVTIATGQTLTLTGSGTALSYTANATGNAQTITMQGTGNLTVNTGNVVVNAPTAKGSSLVTCAASATGTLSIAGTLGITGNSTNTGLASFDMLTCRLTVTGLTTLTGGSNSTGKARITASTGIVDTNGGLTLAGTAGNALFSTSGITTWNNVGTISGGSAASFSFTARTLLKTTGTSAINTAYTSLPDVEVVSGTTTLGAAQTVTGLQVDSGATLAGSTFLLTSTCAGTGTAGFRIDGTFSGSGGVTLNTATCTIDAQGAGAKLVSNTGTFTISANATIASTASISIGAAGGTNPLTVSAGTTTNNGTVSILSDGTGAGLTGAGAWTNAANSTLNTAGATTTAISITTLTATANPNTVNYSGAAQTCKVTQYYHLTLSGSGAKTCAPTSPTLGNVTVTGTATWTQTATEAISGNLIISGGTLTTAAFAFTVTGTTSISSGTLTLNDNTGSKTLTGLATTTGGTLNGSSTAIVLGAGVTNTTGTVQLYGNVTMSTLNGALTATTAIEIVTLFVDTATAFSFSGAGGLLVWGSFWVTSPAVVTNTGLVELRGSLNGTGGFTNGNGGNLKIKFTGPPAITTLTATANSNTVEYMLSGAQTCKVTQYYHLTLSGSGAKTCAPTSPTLGNVTVTGTATWTQTATEAISGNLIISGGTLTTAAFAFTVTGTTSISSGTLTLNDNTGSKTLTGLATTTGGTLNGSSTAIVLGAGVTNTTGTVSITGTATMSTLDGALTSTTAMSITTLTMNTAAAFTHSGAGGLTVTTLTVTSPAVVTNTGLVQVNTSLTGTGNFTNGASGTLKINFTGEPAITTLTATASSNTVNYMFSGTQTVRATTYHHLTLSGTSAKTLTSLATINGDFTLSGTASATLVSAVTVGGNLLVGDGSNAASLTTGAFTFGVTGNITIAGLSTLNGNASTALSVGGNWDNDGAFVANSCTVTFNSTSGTKTIDADGTGAEAFNHVTFNDGGGSATFQLTTAMDVDGNFTITGGNFDANSQSINVGGNWDNDDTFTSGTQTVTFDAADTDNTIDADGTGTDSFSSVTFAGSDGSGTWALNTDMTAAATLNIDTSDIVSVDSSMTLTLSGNSGTTLTLSGTLNGPGRLTYQNSATTFPTTGTLAATLITRFDTVNGNLVIPARTDYGAIEVYGASANARTVTLGTAGSQTITTSSYLYVIADAASPNHVTLQGATWDPTLNIGGDFDFTGTGAANEIVTAPDAAATWTVSGNVNFTSGTYTKSAETLVMNGTGTLTSNSQTLQNLTLSGSITLADEIHTVAGNLSMAGGTITAGASTMIMTGTANTITGGGATLNNLSINPSAPGTITLQTSDLTVSNTLTVFASDALTLNASRTLTISSFGTTSLNGTINGPGRLTHQSVLTFPTTGTLAATLITRFDTVNGNLVIPARTDYGAIEVYGASANARTVTLGTAGSQTITTSSYLYVIADAASPNHVTLQGATWDPTLNIGGDFDFTGTGAANEIVTAPDAAATWTVSGNVNFTDGTYTKSAETLVMNGTSKTLTSASQTLNNLTLSGTITLANATHTIAGNLSMASGVITAGSSTITMSGTSNTITGGGATLNNLTIDPATAGTITAQTSDFTVSSALSVATGDTLSIASGITVTWTGSSFTLDGTISGSGRLTVNTATVIPTGGTLSSVVRFYMGGGTVTAPARTYGSDVEVYNNTSSILLLLGAGTHTIGGSVLVIADGIGGLTYDGSANNPTVNITGSIDFTGSGSGTEDIATGTGIWTVSGNVDFTDGTLTATAGNTFRMNGSGKTLTSASQSFRNFAVTGGSVSSTDAMDVNGTFQVTGGGFTQAANANINVLGNMTLSSGTTFTAASGSGRLVFDGDLTYTDNTSPVQTVSHMQVSTATVDLASDMAATGLTVDNLRLFNTNGYEVDIGTNGINIVGLMDFADDVELDETFVTDAGSLTVASTASLNIDQSTITMDGTSGTVDVITDGSHSLYNFIINDGGNALTVELEDSLDVNNNLTITGGTLDTKSGEDNAITVGGSWDNDDTFEARSGLVTFDAGSGTKTIDADGTGTDAFNHVVFNDSAGTAVFQLTTNMDVNGNFTITGGEVQPQTNTINLAGNWSNSDLFTHGSSTVVFDSGVGGQTITTSNTVSNMGAGSAITDETGKRFNNVQINSSGTVTLGSGTDNDLSVQGNLTFTAGILDIGDNDNHIVIKGNWDASAVTEAAFEARESTYSSIPQVQFYGTSAQTITIQSGQTLLVDSVTFGDIGLAETTYTLKSSGGTVGTFQFYDYFIILSGVVTTSDDTNADVTVDGAGGVEQLIVGDTAGEDSAAYKEFQANDSTVSVKEIQVTNGETAGDYAKFVAENATVTVTGLIRIGDTGETTESFNTFDASTTSSNTVSAETLYVQVGTVTLGDSRPWDIGRNGTSGYGIRIYANGTLDGATNTSDSVITTMGDFAIDTGGTFSAGSTTVTLDGAAATAQKIDPDGDITFNNLALDDTGNRTVTIADVDTSGRRVTVSGTFTWDGTVAANAVDVQIGSTTFTAILDLTNATAANSSVIVPSGRTLTMITTSSIELSGNWTNNGTFTRATSTVTAEGSNQQTFSGTLTGASQFYNLTITNSSGSDPESSPSLIFGAAATTENNFTATTANTKLRFNAGSTYTFQTISFNGQATGTRVVLRSSTQGTQWNLNVAGTRSVSNTDVRDSNACGQAPIIDATDGTNLDAGNNSCWDMNSITFSISDTTIGFGALSAATGRWATGDLNGSNASAGSTPTAAHTMTITTNARSGYAITYSGATLTSGGNTIDVASIDEDSDGTPGSEQYGLSVSTDGNATIASGYLRDTAADFTWVASTTTTIVSETSSTATETISASYLGNISTVTEAGSYSTTVTYIASGTF